MILQSQNSPDLLHKFRRLPFGQRSRTTFFCLWSESQTFSKLSFLVPESSFSSLLSGDPACSSHSSSELEICWPPTTHFPLFCGASLYWASSSNLVWLILAIPSLFPSSLDMFITRIKLRRGWERVHCHVFKLWQLQIY